MHKTSKFYEKAYKLCKKIPKGKVTTYGAIARKLGSNAYRAVGTAMNKNPYGILRCNGKSMVPCHRVINSNGFVGQFAHGSKAKIKLLQSEGIFVDKSKMINLKKYLFNFK
jgi:methylated-DNA-[protein]-cysteine S-methyltransferase